MAQTERERRREQLEEEYFRYSLKLRRDGFNEALGEALCKTEEELRAYGGDPDAIAERAQRETRRDD